MTALDTTGCIDPSCHSMAARPWWTYVLQWGAWFVVMSLVMVWLERSRHPARSSAPATVLKYPRSYLVVGITCSVGLFALAGSSARDGSPLVCSMFLGFALAGLVMVGEYLRVRYRLAPGGLRYRTLLGKRGFLRWADMRRIRYSSVAKWFRIEGAQGEVVRVSAMMRSLPEFARAALADVSRDGIDPATVDVLEATASGSPPSLWV
jgi:hypothetical protein